MARVKIPLVALGPDGRPLANATMTVRDRATGSADTVYAAETGGVTLTLAQQVSDAQGRFPGWTGRGRKEATITPPGGSGLAPWIESWEAGPAGDGDIDNPWLSDAELRALAAVVSGANKVPYFDGVGSAAVTDLSAYIRTLLGQSDAAAARGILGARADATPSCRATGATQALTHDTFQPLALNAESWDTDTMHDNATNNTRLTCKTAGKYAISAGVKFANTAAGTLRLLGIWVNGAEVALTALPFVGPALCRGAISTIYDLAVNDYIEVIAYQDTGGNLNAVAPFLAAARIGA